MLSCIVRVLGRVGMNCTSYVLLWVCKLYLFSCTKFLELLRPDLFTPLLKNYECQAQLAQNSEGRRTRGYVHRCTACFFCVYDMMTQSEPSPFLPKVYYMSNALFFLFLFLKNNHWYDFSFFFFENNGMTFLIWNYYFKVLLFGRTLRVIYNR
jgi:hypothetical protein